MKEMTINKIVLSCGAAFIISCLHAVDNSTMQVFHKPDFLVLAKEYDPLFCALIAVGLGCNFSEGGESLQIMIHYCQTPFLYNLDRGYHLTQQVATVDRTFSLHGVTGDSILKMLFSRGSNSAFR